MLEAYFDAPSDEDHNLDSDRVNELLAEDNDVDKVGLLVSVSGGLKDFLANKQHVRYYNIAYAIDLIDELYDEDLFLVDKKKLYIAYLLSSRLDSVMSIESLGLSRWVFEQIGESVLKNTDPRVKDVRQRMVYIIESPSRSGNTKMIEIFGKVEAQYRLGLRNPVEIMDLLISGGLEVELLDVCTAMLYFRLKDEKKRKLQERIDDIQLVEGI